MKKTTPIKSAIYVCVYSVYIVYYVYIISSSSVLQLNSAWCRKTAIYVTDCRKNK